MLCNLCVFVPEQLKLWYVTLILVSNIKDCTQPHIFCILEIILKLKVILSPFCGWACRSGLEQDDMRILYKYLTTSLFPRHTEPEVRRHWFSSQSPDKDCHEGHDKAYVTLSLLILVWQWILRCSLFSWLAETLLWGLRLQGICCTMGGEAPITCFLYCSKKIQSDLYYQWSHLLLHVLISKPAYNKRQVIWLLELVCLIV